MTPIRSCALLLVLAAPLATGGCGMVNSVTDMFSSSSTPARRTVAAPHRQSRQEPEPEPAAAEPRVSVADKLSDSDRTAIERAAARALARGETGDAVAWRNPKSGNRGSVTPTSPAYRAHGGRLCRDYQLTVRLGAGGSETLVGTRCRGSRGRWPQVN